VNGFFPPSLNLPLGLLKQLLVQQLGLTEKSAQEDWPHFPSYRTASSGVQTDGGAQNSENSKAYPPVEGQMPFRTGTGDIATCHSPRTSTESPASRDSVVLAFQDSQASTIFVMDHMLMTPEMPPAEPEGSLDESGEHFFDAREAHSDDNPSEGDGAVKKEEDVNLRISGNYLILDGYDAVQESSTDEEVASSLPPPPATGIPSMDSAPPQHHSPQRAHSDGAASPFTPEFLVQQRWGAMDDSCFEIQSPPSCADSQSQIMEYIRKIEADLEHLKVPQTSASSRLG